MKRGDELAEEFRRAGKTPDAKMVDGALDSEIKAGKLKASSIAREFDARDALGDGLGNLDGPHHDQHQEMQHGQ